jgi:predicted aspartyl protease
MARVKLTNLVDRENAKNGLIRPEDVRSVEVEALVDTGATTMFIPFDLAEKLNNGA